MVDRADRGRRATQVAAAAGQRVDTWATMPLSALHDATALERFLDTLEWYIGQTASARQPDNL
jgi:hypothetical protein